MTTNNTCNNMNKIVSIIAHKYISINRREKLIILHVWKIKNEVVPNDINLKFSLNDHKSRFEAVVKPLPRVRGRLLTMYESSFQIKAVKLWNKLPNQITRLNNLTAFNEKNKQVFDLLSR